MRNLIALILLLGLLLTSGANAASYQMTDGTIVDPIQYRCGAFPFPPCGDHPYAGANLEPNESFGGADLDYADLSNADLRGAVLDSAKLYDAILTGANLTIANLFEANLTNADLSGAILYEANLHSTDLSGATLYEANLHSAYLWDANLTGADLTGADLTAANLRYAHMYGADLTNANLTDARYLGQSAGSPYYNAETDFTNAWDGVPGSTLFDPVAAGWTFVPEPNGMLLGIAALSCVGLLARRRAH